MYELLLELLKPFPLLLGLLGVLLVRLWRRCPERRRLCRAALVVYALLVLDTLPWTLHFTSGWLENVYPRVASRPEGTRAIVVLGGGVISPRDGQPSSRPDESSLVRTMRAWELYRDGPPCLVIVTGAGTPEAGSVADVMAAWLQDVGVPEADILVEGQARNTAENAELTLQLLRARGIDDGIVMVSTATHLWRAERNFRNRGVVVTPIGCDYQSDRVPTNWTQFWPSGRAALLNQAAWHEYLGAAWLWLCGRW
jgi:uncharacterized SAM-binding protein YcdF (DUF218 family)